MKDLISGCISGSRKSQEQVFKQLYPKMMGMCMRYAKDKTEAQDFLQNGMIKVFTNIHKFNESGNFESWAKKIVKNSIIDEFRKRKIFIEFSDSFVDQSEPEISEEFEDIPSIKLIEFIQQLPDNLRAVFNMYVFEEMTHREISTSLKIAEGTSKANLFKAKRKLADKCKLYIENE